MELTVRKIEQAERSAFFDLAQEQGSFFCSNHWISSLGDEAICFGIFDVQNNLFGGFVAAELKLKWIKVLAPPTLTPHCGLFFKLIAVNNASRAGIIKDVGKALSNFFKGYPVKVVTMPFPPEYTDMQPFHWGGFKVVPKFTFRLDLEQSEEDIVAGFSPKLRNVLKKGENLKLKVELNTNVDNALQPIASRWRSKGLLNEFRVLTQVARHFEGTKHANFISVSNGESISATCVCVQDTETCYYIAGGYEQGGNAAGPIAIRAAISSAKSRGVKVFDFEGSMIPEIEKYFRSFGGQLVPYYTVNRAGFFMEVLLKFFRRPYF